jgi:APA family basic amino acid/polyamine antiporter
MSATESSAADINQQPRRALSLFDSTSIIVGIIIGSAIYESSPLVAAGAIDWTFDYPIGRASYDWLRYLLVCGIWIAGGVVALLGAMCYAELGTAYPHAGGTYVYLSESLGRSVGFAFAWVEFWIVRPGNVGAVAFVLARYAAQLLPAGSQRIGHLDLHLACGAILILGVLNAAGLRAGTWTQNALTACKVLGLFAIVATALSLAPPDAGGMQPAREIGSLPLAMILVMFAYGGWADMSFVAAEVRHPERNIFRALLLGTLAVTLIYVAVNMAFVYALGIEGLAGADAVAADVLALRFGSGGSRAISLLVVLSCLGAINGMLFTGARVYYALGRHHPTFRWLGTWNERSGVPLRSLAMQTLITIGLVVGFGLSEGGFARLVVFTGPFYWGFIALVGVALIVLRLRGRTDDKSLYRVPLFPLTPVLFTLTSGAMVYAAIDYAIRNPADQAAWWAGIVIVTGLVVGAIDWLSRRR